MKTDATAATLGGDLRRQDAGPFLTNRRRVAALTVTAMGCMSVVALYQLGVLSRLPDLPVAGARSPEIVGSPQAYRRLGIGDGFLGVLSYALTLALAGAGSSRRWHDTPALPVALAVKSAADVAIVTTFTADELTKYRGFCTACVIATAATAAAFPFTLAEAAAAIRRIE